MSQNKITILSSETFICAEIPMYSLVNMLIIVFTSCLHRAKGDLPQKENGSNDKFIIIAILN